MSIRVSTSFKRPSFHPELGEGRPRVVEERLSHQVHIQAGEQEKLRKPPHAAESRTNWSLMNI